MRSVQYVHDGSSQERAADLYRTKGLLNFMDKEIPSLGFRECMSKLFLDLLTHHGVFIGKDLDKKLLTKSLMECLCKEEEK
jgi:hypothetical protein|eukprot:scaffold7846_cov240-Chaetoceros_neogracile.AAC.4